MRSGVKSLLFAARVASACAASGGLVLFGSAPAKGEVAVQAPASGELPQGAESVRAIRRADTGTDAPGSSASVCSFRLPICVRPGEPALGRMALTWLGELEIAYRRAVDVLQLPAPARSDRSGGRRGVELYLVPDDRDLDVHSDATDPLGSRDVAASFCTVGASVRPTARDAALCVGEAIALRLDATETPFARRALATEIWWATGVPSSVDAERIDDVQSHPERAVIARERTRAAEGSALFFEFLRRAHATTTTVDGAVAAFALSSQGASRASFRLANEPDVADILRATFGPTPTSVAGLYGRFAVARAGLGSRDAEGAFPELLGISDCGRPRFEWSVALSSLPRRLAPARPVEPTGATYLWLDIDRDPGSAHLVFHADWEPPVGFQWELVLLDDRGRSLRRVTVPFLERATSVDQTVSDLRGARGVLIAGTNLGGLGPSYPFDPDFEPYEPHSYDVTLRAE